MKKITAKFHESRISLIMLVIAPIFTFYLLEWYTHNPFQTMSVTTHVLNIFMFEVIALLLFTLIGRLHIALIAETLFFAIYGLVNYFVLEFRSIPIQPWDLFSIRTAANVADNYSYKLDRQAFLVILGFLLLLVPEFISRYTMKRGSWKKRIPAASVFAAALCLFALMFRSDVIVQQKLRLYDKLFTPTTISYKNGTALAFIMELRYVSVDKPENYDSEETVAALALLEGEAEEPEKAPNIIVIMDEAFSDPSILGDFSTNEDYMPFVRSMMNGAQDTVSGWLNVSVLGGNTANTEFEYLTGHTMAFLPLGSVAYQQYISDETPSMASWLAANGYQTVAMHPYSASGWDRDEVYPWLGLSESCFLDDFQNAEYIRKYVSDQSDFEKIIEIYENKEEDKPLFLFNVTMQNHSSYTESFSNFHPEIEAEGNNTKALNNYLSLMKLSDEALQNLISYFETQEEETILVFFGDHQPNNSVIEPVLKANGKKSSTLTEEELVDRYRVPFLIWANYDIEEESGVETSANYLGARTLEIAGLPQPGYWNYLLSLQQNVPVITANHVKLSDGTLTSADDQRKLLSDYRAYQYYLLFDTEED